MPGAVEGHLFRARQNLGKYRIERKFADGGFAAVYQAFDTIEGIRVALKVPHPGVMNSESLEDFRKEVKLAARLDHPNILPLKNAGYVDGHFVISFALGERSLADRIRRRLSVRMALDYGEQMLEGAAYAHRQRIIHCDIKPENFILFAENRLRLSDFGIARVALRTVHASGSGTIGYIAPEQAMGRPSLRSDVFSLGLVLYRMLAGTLPEWPYEWPPRGYRNLRGRVHPEVIELIRRAIQVDPRRRFRDATQMLEAWRRIKSRALRHATVSRTRRVGERSTRDWQTVRRQQFLREYGSKLESHHECSRCQGPVAESMKCCPWCGRDRRVHRGETRFPAQCPRCARGMKLDWRFCPWCYGAGFEPLSTRSYSDARYQERCTNPSCSRKLLMPFMRYCPWCRSKVKRNWKVPGSKEKCGACGWGVLSAFWSFCPWCKKPLSQR